GIDATHRLDLEARAWLAVRDDGQGLEHRAGEAWRPFAQETPHERRVLGRSAELIAAGNVRDPQSAPIALVARRQRLEGGEHLGPAGTVERLDEAGDGYR